MTQAQAETAVTTSALVCGGMYAYRKVTEHVKGATPAAAKPTPKSTAAGVIGVGELLPAGTWLTGAGVTFITLSILTSINGNFGGSLAILVATGAILGNGQAVIADVNQGIQKPQAQEANTREKQQQQQMTPAAGNHPPTSKVR
jgi:hypothetical protein